MDKTVRIVTDLVEQQAKTYRYWQSVSDSERKRTTWNLTIEMYRLRGDFSEKRRTLTALGAEDDS